MARNVMDVPGTFRADARSDACWSVKAPEIISEPPALADRIRGAAITFSPDRRTRATLADVRRREGAEAVG